MMIEEAEALQQQIDVLCERLEPQLQKIHEAHAWKRAVLVEMGYGNVYAQLSGYITAIENDDGENLAQLQNTCQEKIKMIPKIREASFKPQKENLVDKMPLISPRPTGCSLVQYLSFLQREELFVTSFSIEIQRKEVLQQILTRVDAQKLITELESKRDACRKKLTDYLCGGYFFGQQIRSKLCAYEVLLKDARQTFSELQLLLDESTPLVFQCVLETGPTYGTLSPAN